MSCMLNCLVAFLSAAMQAEQAMRNAEIKEIPTELLEECTQATELLRAAYLRVGGEVDPYGKTCRIHGNVFP